MRRSWDAQEGEIAPKSKAGTRTVPLIGSFAPGWSRTGSAPAVPSASCSARTASGIPYESLIGRTRKAWAALNANRAEQELEAVEPLTLHEARHTYATLAIAAGVNVKALSTYMGHSSVTITLDRYGHLFPGNEQEAAGLLDRCLAEAGS